MVCCGRVDDVCNHHWAFLAYILLCARCRLLVNSIKQEQNPAPQPGEVDSTYQELNHTKLTIEDVPNYQSMRVNAASNDNMTLLVLS